MVEAAVTSPSLCGYFHPCLRKTVCVRWVNLSSLCLQDTRRATWMIAIYRLSMRAVWWADWPLPSARRNILVGFSREDQGHIVLWGHIPMTIWGKRMSASSRRETIRLKVWTSKPKTPVGLFSKCDGGRTLNMLAESRDLLRTLKACPRWGWAHTDW